MDSKEDINLISQVFDGEGGEDGRAEGRVLFHIRHGQGQVNKLPAPKELRI